LWLQTRNGRKERKKGVFLRKKKPRKRRESRGFCKGGGEKGGERMKTSRGGPAPVMYDGQRKKKGGKVTHVQSKGKKKVPLWWKENKKEKKRKRIPSLFCQKKGKKGRGPSLVWQKREPACFAPRGGGRKEGVVCLGRKRNEMKKVR